VSVWLALGTALALGAASGAHCAAMCGPLAAVGCAWEGRVSGRRAAGYLGGRGLGYAALGALAGGVGAPFAAGAAGAGVRLGVAVLVAAVLVGRAASWLWPARAARAKGAVLLRLGRGPAGPPAGPGLLARVLPLLPRRGVGMGLATAVFPCGALLGGVLAAAASGSAALGAAMMAVFALGSAPLLLLPALLGARLGPRLREGWPRRASALALLAVAAWMVTPPLLALTRPETKACCASPPG
jgi:uncharacterized protein